MKPTASQTSWIVWTDDRTNHVSAMARTAWRWAAHGPLGSEAGVAETSDEAVQRAYSAAMLNAATEPTRAST